MQVNIFLTTMRMPYLCCQAPDPFKTSGHLEQFDRLCRATLWCLMPVSSVSLPQYPGLDIYVVSWFSLLFWKQCEVKCLLFFHQFTGIKVESLHNNGTCDRVLTYCQIAITSVQCLSVTETGHQISNPPTSVSHCSNKG